MNYKQSGSAHIVLIGIIIVLTIGLLLYVFLSNSNQAETSVITSETTQPTKKTSNKSLQNDVEFADWKVKFSSDTNYTLKLNSNRTAYFISVQELAGTCETPDTPWLGIIQRFENPEEKQTVGPNAGKTMNQIFGSRGKIVDGKLYYFDTATQFCTRNTSNPAIEQAAKKLESEIKSLEGY